MPRCEASSALFGSAAAAAWDVGASAGPSRLAPSMLVRASEECHGLAWECAWVVAEVGESWVVAEVGEVGVA